MISTNGGLRVLKYGMIGNSFLGPRGSGNGRTVISSMKIIKDNSAYDVKQLFIGSEDWAL
jgi:FAD/FMN-containing dehydrogenase